MYVPFHIESDIFVRFYSKLECGGIILYYIILYYITLCYVILYYIVLYYINLITLHNTKVNEIPFSERRVIPSVGTDERTDGRTCMTKFTVTSCKLFVDRVKNKQIFSMHSEKKKVLFFRLRLNIFVREIIEYCLYDAYMSL